MDRLSKNSFDNKKIAYVSLLIALAMIFSYIESLIPLNFGIPGIKIGLANIVSVLTLYLFGTIPSIIVVATRVLLSGFLFGNMYSIVYSLVGGILSVFIMAFLKKCNGFTLLGVSIGGGVSHNLAQLAVAMLIVEQIRLSYYGPVLIVAGVLMGTAIGIISRQILIRVETYVR